MFNLPYLTTPLSITLTVIGPSSRLQGQVLPTSLELELSISNVATRFLLLTMFDKIEMSVLKRGYPIATG